MSHSVILPHFEWWPMTILPSKHSQHLHQGCSLMPAKYFTIPRRTLTAVRTVVALKRMCSAPNWIIGPLHRGERPGRQLLMLAPHSVDVLVDHNVYAQQYVELH